MQKGLCKDENNKLVMITKLSNEKFLVTHEENRSCLINSKGEIIIAEYLED